MMIEAMERELIYTYLGDISPEGQKPFWGFLVICPGKNRLLNWESLIRSEYKIVGERYSSFIYHLLDQNPVLGF